MADKSEIYQKSTELEKWHTVEEGAYNDIINFGSSISQSDDSVHGYFRSSYLEAQVLMIQVCLLIEIRKNASKCSSQGKWLVRWIALHLNLKKAMKLAFILN